MIQTVAGASYWTASAKVNQYPYLSEDIDCDVAVVGGGITGALCAYVLQQAGVDTVLLDASLLGFGTTGASSSILQYDIDYDLDSLKDLIGLDKAVRAYNACGRGLCEIEKTTKDIGANVGFARRDSLYYTPCSGSSHKIKQEYLLRKRHNFPVEFLDSVKAADRFSFRVEGGIFTTGMAGEIDPFRFTMALVEEAVSMGMRVYENTSVETVSPDADGVNLNTNTRHNVNAKKMVNATGFSAAKEVGHIAQQRTTFCVVTAPVSDFDGWYNRCIIRDDSAPCTYMRTLPDDRILIGGLDSRIIDSRGQFAGFLKLPTLIDNKYSYLEQKLESMMTGIEGITSEYRYSGTTMDTGDGLPYIGTQEGIPNVYFDICGGSNGLVFAQLGADIIRDLYLGGDAQDLDLFSFGRI